MTSDSTHLQPLLNKKEQMGTEFSGEGRFLTFTSPIYIKQQGKDVKRKMTFFS